MALTDHAVTVDDVIDAWNDSLFGALPKPLGQALFEASRVEVFDPGDIVLRGADPHAFVIVDGLVRVYMRGRDGRQATIRYAMQGDAVGVPPVFHRGIDVYGDAITHIKLIRLPTQRFRALTQREPTLGWAVVQHLAAQIATTNDTLSADVFLPVRARVARHLLDLARRESAGLVVRASHQQIANAIGSVREVVSREMRRFTEDGLIARATDGVVLLDSAELHRLSGGG